MINLVTGSPGAGKTLWTVKTVIDELIPSGRPIFLNINGFRFDAENVHALEGDEAKSLPFNWHEPDKYPDGSIFVFDEVQQQYPTRHSTAKVPRHISQFETHRHRGMDFYLVTQGPRLIDRHIWPLVERHVHLFRAFGLQRTRILEWGGVNDEPQPPQSHSIAMKENFRFPKKYFEFYKSASLHTVKARLPWKIIIFILLCLCVVGYAVFSVLSFVRKTTTTTPDSHLAIAMGVDDVQAELLCNVRVIAASDTHLYYIDERRTPARSEIHYENGKNFLLLSDGVSKCYINTR